MTIFSRTLLIAAMAWPPALALAGQDSDTAPLPVPYFFKSAEIGTAALSPNGRYLATTALKKGTLQLAVVDLDTSEAKVLVGHASLDIANVAWLNDERLAYSVINRSTPDDASPGGLYTIARGGGQPIALITTPGDLRPRAGTDLRTMQLVRAARDGSQDVLVMGRIWEGGDARPLRVGSVSARRTEIEFDVPGKALQFWFDGKDELRVAVTSTGEDMQTLQVWFRDSGSRKWRMLATFPTFTPDFEVVGMLEDTLYVAAPAGAHDGLYKYDTAANKLGELVLADPDVDVGGGLVVAGDSHKLLGVRIAAEPPRTHWFDPALAALQKAVDRSYPKHVNVLSPGRADAPFLVISYSASDPGRVLRYTPATRKLATLFLNRPWIDTAKMSETVVFDYKARDELPIMAYLTMPKGRAPKKLPLIVYPHGGPTARDWPGFDPVAQFLANRGYVVLQPQFRGSAGFGLAHMKKGFRQWGLAMQDDLSDGVRTLVAQGVVDPKRVCIMGISYGGYATMMGLAKDPDQYQCGINLLGVTDLNDLLRQGRWAGDAFRYQSKLMIGDPATMKAQLDQTSPVKRAGDMRAPVFMAYGEKDRRVPLSHGTDMRDALKKAGKTYEWMSFDNEEHGFVHEENRFKVFSGIDAFLSKYNPAQ